jgi:hypothetical protein
MSSHLVPGSPAPREASMPRRAYQRPHRCSRCGSLLLWEARARVEQFAWDYFTCPNGCAHFYLQSGAHVPQELE